MDGCQGLIYRKIHCRHASYPLLFQSPPGFLSLSSLPSSHARNKIQNIVHQLNQFEKLQVNMCFPKQHKRKPHSKCSPITLSSSKQIESLAITIMYAFFLPASPPPSVDACRRTGVQVSVDGRDVAANVSLKRLPALPSRSSTNVASSFFRRLRLLYQTSQLRRTMLLGFARDSMVLRGFVLCSKGRDRDQHVAGRQLVHATSTRCTECNPTFCACTSNTITGNVVHLTIDCGGWFEGSSDQVLVLFQSRVPPAIIPCRGDAWCSLIESGTLFLASIPLPPFISHAPPTLNALFCTALG